MRSRPLPFEREGETATLVLTARQLLEPDQPARTLLLIEEFERTHLLPAPRGEAAELEPGAVEESQVKALEQHLHEKDQRLQVLVEEHETSREEMKAANEELQSANEELRSTLEELETSKEELQSMNEELSTLNQENRHKVEELGQLSDDLQNLLVSTDIATLFLDRDMRILRYTPKLGEIFSVRPTDRGRPIGELAHRLNYDGLLQDAEQVLAKLSPVEREVSDQNGRTYLARCLPYRSAEDRIAGIVLSFIDISERKQAELKVQEAKAYFEHIISTLHEPLLVLSPELKIEFSNEAFYDSFMVDSAHTLGREIYELGNGQWDIPELRRLLEEILPQQQVFNDYEVTHHFPQIGRRVMLLNARKLDHQELILLGIRDITHSKKIEQQLRDSEAQQALLVRLGDAVRPLQAPQEVQQVAARRLERAPEGGLVDPRPRSLEELAAVAEDEPALGLAAPPGPERAPRARRAEEIVMPNGDTVIEPGDEVVVLTPSENADEVRRLMRRRPGAEMTDSGDVEH